MNKIIKASQLDMMIIKQYKKTTLWLVGFCALLGVCFDSIAIGVIWAECILSMRCLSIVFDAEERDNVGKFYSFIPFSSAQKVNGRYFFCAFWGIVLSLLIFVFQILIHLAMSKPINSVTELLTISLTGGAILLFNISYQIPVYYKFGTVKGRMSGIVILVIIGAAGGFIASTGDKYKKLLSKSLSELLPLSAIIFLCMVILVVISCMISVKIYENKK